MRRALVGITNCGASALLKESASQGLWGHHLGPAFARWASSDSTMDLAKLDDLKKLLSPDYKKAVLLDCYASWCEPCKALTPRLEQAVKNAENVVLAKLDVDNPEFEEKLVELRVSAVPSIFAYHKGALLASQTGLLPQDAIDALVKELDTRAASE